MKNYLARAEKFATYIQKPVLMIFDLFGDGVNYWFVIDSWKGFNPSSHIHFNELRGKNITEIMNHTDEYDQVRFITKCDELDISTIKFDPDKNWVSVNPVIVKFQ